MIFAARLRQYALDVFVWLLGPVLCALYGESLPWIVAGALFLLLAAEVASWERMFRFEGLPNTSMLLLSGDVVDGRWWSISHALSGAFAVLTIVATGFGAVPYFSMDGAVPLLAMAWFSMLLALVRAASLFRSYLMLVMVRSLLEGRPATTIRILKLFFRKRSESVLAEALLQQGDVQQATEVLSVVDSKGPLVPGSALVALLKLRAGDASLLERWVADTPADNLYSQYLMTQMRLHHSIALGNDDDDSVHRALRLEARLPPRYREPITVLRQVLAGQSLDVPPRLSYLFKVYPWLNGPWSPEESLTPMVKAPGESHAFAAPATKLVVRKAATTVGLFPIEWYPVLSNRSRTWAFVFQAIIALVSVAMGVVLALGVRSGEEQALLIPMLFLVIFVPSLALAGVRTWAEQGNGPFLDGHGELHWRRIHLQRAVWWYRSYLYRYAALLLGIGLDASLLTWWGGRADLAILPVVGFLLLLAFSYRQVSARLDVLLWACGGREGEPPVLRDEGRLDQSAWLGLGHLLRGNCEQAEEAWRRSSFAESASLRAILQSKTRELRNTPLPQARYLGLLWRRVMLRLLIAQRTGTWSEVQGDIKVIQRAFAGLKSPFIELLYALIERGEARNEGQQPKPHPVLDAIEAYDAAA